MSSSDLGEINKIRHTILMICYNQEAFIGRALDSILNEEIKPYEIVIGDDFSSDQTVKILKEYQRKFPEIIKLVLNEKNIGISSNLNNIVRYVTGDVVSLLAGDDWYRPKFLENMNKAIEANQLNPKRSKFILMPNVILHYGDGKEDVLINDPKLFDRYTPVGLILKGLFHNQNTGLSRALFDFWPAYETDSKEIGAWSDRVHHVMFVQHADKLVAMECDGPVYRLGVGISSRTSHDDLERSFKKALIRIRLHFQKGTLLLNSADAYYLEFLIAKTRLGLEFKFISALNFFLTAFRAIKVDVGSTQYVRQEFLVVIRQLLSKLKKNMRKTLTKYTKL